MEYIDWLYIFYLTPTSHFLMLGFYLPILILIGRLIYRWLDWPKSAKMPVIVACVTLAFFAPVFDVMKTGLDMHYYCNNEHGEHIYKTAKTDSLYGQSISVDRYLEAGFGYVERYSKGKLYRFELSAGEKVKTPIESPTSEFGIEREEINLENNISLRIYRIRSRSTQEVLAEAKNYSGYYGWLDRVTPDLGTHVFNCFKPRVFGSQKFVLQVLEPNKN